ncbi:MAG: DivIVA domain-containing protein [Clostridia bacterium]|nr:DivIVA domain-containing protein [Clostridia bacterium]
MITSTEIKNVTFSNSMAGYKKDEVDILLDKVEVDLEKYETITKKQEEKIDRLESQIAELKEAQSSIQSVLLNAQRLADKIVEDAKSESKKIVMDAQNNIDQMTEKSKQIAGEFDLKATEKKERLENELSGILKVAEEKKEAIEKATKKAVCEQQDIFNNIKREVAEFKKEINEKYKEHLSILASLPDFAEIDPQTAAVNAEKEIEEKSAEAEKESEAQELTEETVEEIAKEPTEETVEEIAEEPTEETEEEIAEEPEEETEDEQKDESEDNGLYVTQTFDVNEINFDDSEE